MQVGSMNEPAEIVPNGQARFQASHAVLGMKALPPSQLNGKNGYGVGLIVLVTR